MSVAAPIIPSMLDLVAVAAQVRRMGAGVAALAQEIDAEARSSTDSVGTSRQAGRRSARPRQRREDELARCRAARAARRIRRASRLRLQRRRFGRIADLARPARKRRVLPRQRRHRRHLLPRRHRAADLRPGDLVGAGRRLSARRRLPAGSRRTRRRRSPLRRRVRWDPRTSRGRPGWSFDRAGRRHAPAVVAGDRRTIACVVSHRTT